MAEQRDPKILLCKVLYGKCRKLIEEQKEKMNKAAGRTVAYQSSLLSSSIPIIVFISTNMNAASSSSNNHRLSILFEEMNVKFLKGTTMYDQSSMDVLQEEAMESLREIEEILEKEYSNHEETVHKRKELFMTYVLLRSIECMMSFGNSRGVNEEEAFRERLRLDSFIQQIQNKLESFHDTFAQGGPNEVREVNEHMKGNQRAFLEEFLTISMDYAQNREKSYLDKLDNYLRETEVRKQYRNFIAREKAKAAQRSKSRKLLLAEMDDDIKIAMGIIMEKVRELKIAVEDERAPSGVDMVSFYDVMISASRQILSKMISISSMPREQVPIEEVKLYLSNIFENLHKDLLAVINNTASSSTRDSGSNPNRKQKIRIRDNIREMELQVRNKVANNSKIEEEMRLMLLSLMAKLLLSNLELSPPYARNLSSGTCIPFYNKEDYHRLWSN